MKRIPKRWWRRIHLTSYAVAVMTTIHLFTAGTDATTVALRWVTIAAGLHHLLPALPEVGPKKAARIPAAARTREIATAE